MKKEEISDALKKATNKYVGKKFIDKQTHRKVFIKEISITNIDGEYQFILHLCGLEEESYNLPYPLNGFENSFLPI